MTPETEKQIELYKAFLARKIADSPNSGDPVNYTKYRETAGGQEFPDENGNYSSAVPEEPTVQTLQPATVLGQPALRQQRPVFFNEPTNRVVHGVAEEIAKKIKPVAQEWLPDAVKEHFEQKNVVRDKKLLAAEDAANAESVQATRSVPEKSREMPGPRGTISAQDAAEEELKHATAARELNDTKAEQQHLGEALKYNISARSYYDYGLAQEKNGEDPSGVYALAQVASTKPGSAGLAKFTNEELKHMRETIIEHGGYLAHSQMEINEKIRTITAEYVRRGIEPTTAIEAATDMVFAKEIWHAERKAK